jgi:hypothetical protein
VSDSLRTLLVVECPDCGAGIGQGCRSAPTEALREQGLEPDAVAWCSGRVRAAVDSIIRLAVDEMDAKSEAPRRRRAPSPGPKRKEERDE